MEKLKRIGKFLIEHRPVFIVILGCFFLLSPPFYPECKLLYALSAWLWPFLFLYYAHCSKKSYSQAIVFIFLTLGLSIRFSGVLGADLEGAGGLVIVFAACVFWVPFIWDSAFCNQISSFVYTLVFPALYCSMNLILSVCNVLPICNLTYAQYDNKPLLQLASVVGEFGITFLIAWTASVAVFVIDHWKKPKGKRVGLIALSVLLLLHVGGAIGYVGLVVLHIARMSLGTSNHSRLVPATILAGADIALLCALVSVCNPHSIIPINAITPIVGVPIILYIILNRRRIQYFN
jgi:apolipoprotein N-acyltransferase